MDMNELHCDYQNIDFKSLFSHIELSEDEITSEKKIDSFLDQLD